MMPMALQIDFLLNVKLSRKYSLETRRKVEYRAHTTQQYVSKHGQ
jgi:hypothetical protein